MKPRNSVMKSPEIDVPEYIANILKWHHQRATFSEGFQIYFSTSPERQKLYQVCGYSWNPTSTNFYDSRYKLAIKFLLTTLFNPKNPLSPHEFSLAKLHAANKLREKDNIPQYNIYSYLDNGEVDPHPPDDYDFIVKLAARTICRLVSNFITHDIEYLMRFTTTLNYFSIA